MKKILFILGLFVSMSMFGQGMNVVRTTHHPITVSGGGESVDSTNWIQAYKDWYYEMGNPPELDTADQQEQMLDSLIILGFDEVDAAWLLANKNETDAKLNILNPGVTYTLTDNGVVNFVPYEGLSAPSSAYIDPNMTLSANTYYTLNDASIGSYWLSNVDASNGAFLATGSGLYTTLVIRNSNVLDYDMNNGNTYNSVANTDSRGLFVVDRSASDYLGVYKNGSLLTSTTTVSTAVPSATFIIGASYNNTFAFGWVGKSFTPTEQTGINRVVERYMDYIGKGVQ